MSFNKVIFMGRLTRDPDLRTLTNGTAVCDFGIAVDSGWGDNKKTTFIDVTAWAKQGEMVNKNFKKGDGIHIEGRLEQESWEDKNGGGKRTKHKVVSEKITFMPSSKGSQPKASEPSQWDVGDIDEIPL